MSATNINETVKAFATADDFGSMAKCLLRLEHNVALYIENGVKDERLEQHTWAAISEDCGSVFYDPDLPIDQEGIVGLDHIKNEDHHQRAQTLLTLIRTNLPDVLG